MVLNERHRLGETKHHHPADALLTFCMNWFWTGAPSSAVNAEREEVDVKPVETPSHRDYAGLEKVTWSGRPHRASSATGPEGSE